MEERIKIRTAVPADDEICARIQVASWKAAFQGIIPDTELERATDEEHTRKMYQRVLARSAMHGSLLYVEGKPHGIAFWSRSRDANTADFAELVCIHSLPDNWRRGYGTKLMNHILAEMHAAGFKNAILWVFAENLRARKFYEKCGWTLTEQQRMELGAMAVQYGMDFSSYIPFEENCRTK